MALFGLVRRRAENLPIKEDIKGENVLSIEDASGEIVTARRQMPAKRPA